MINIRGLVLGVFGGALVLLGAIVPSAFAETAPPLQLNQTEIMLKQVTGPSTGLFFGLKWARAGSRCRATQGNPNQPLEWVPIPSRACKGVRDYIIVNRKKLRKSRLSKNFTYNGIVPGRAYLEFSGNRFLVTVLTSPVCDAQGENCKRPVLSEASKLGVVLRQSISREIGKLPEWVKPPGAETLGDP